MTMIPLLSSISILSAKYRIGRGSGTTCDTDAADVTQRTVREGNEDACLSPRVGFSTQVFGRLARFAEGRVSASVCESSQVLRSFSSIFINPVADGCRITDILVVRENSILVRCDLARMLICEGCAGSASDRIDLDWPFSWVGPRLVGLRLSGR